MEVNPEPIAPLACGRDAAVVWDRAEAGTPLDEHERDCPHCRAAHADAAGLDSLVNRMAAQQIEPPPSVMRAVMQAVRSEYRAYDVLTLASNLGPAHLSRPAAAAVLRRVVDEMSGLRARSCRIEQSPEPSLDATGTGDGPADGHRHDGGPAGGGHPTDVTITVAARFGVDLASVTARVRQMVIVAAEQALGVPVRRVDIVVVDLYEEERS